MTREIKFRAWADGKMHYCSGDMYWYLADSGYWSLNYELTDTDAGVICDSLESADPVLMQYTGLVDKSGKEIYEGDVVEYREPGTPHSPPMIMQGIIEYVEECVSFRFLHRGCEEYPIHQDTVIEIIGTVCENPELLEATNDLED